MSAKAVIKPFQVVTDGNMSGDVTSLPTDIESVDAVGYQVVFTGTAVGDFEVHGSINGTNWEALDLGSPSPEAAGVGGSFVISLSLIPYSKLRLKFVRTSGSGTLNAWVMAKRLGG